jgi:hypothetical protein
MNSPSVDLPEKRESALGTAKVKLYWLAQGLRILSVSYAAWVLLRVVQWWTDSEKVIKNLGTYLQRDLSALTENSRMMAMALDLSAWLLMVVAVVCCWKSLGHLIVHRTFSQSMARLLAWAGWLGILSQLLAMLVRPLQSYLITAHLPASEQVFKWAFYPQDILSTMLCGAILCLAYLIAWTVEIAEENRGFV